MYSILSDATLEQLEDRGYESGNESCKMNVTQERHVAEPTRSKFPGLSGRWWKRREQASSVGPSPSPLAVTVDEAAAESNTGVEPHSSLNRPRKPTKIDLSVVPAYSRLGPKSHAQKGLGLGIQSPLAVSSLQPPKPQLSSLMELDIPSPLALPSPAGSGSRPGAMKSKADSYGPLQQVSPPSASVTRSSSTKRRLSVSSFLSRGGSPVPAPPTPPSLFARFAGGFPSPVMAPHSPMSPRQTTTPANSPRVDNQLALKYSHPFLIPSPEQEGPKEHVSTPWAETGHVDVNESSGKDFNPYFAAVSSC